MHYTGTIWRPPYEASSLLLEVTAGCTHHKCKFCTLYHELPFSFRMSPLEDVEADLIEAREQYRLWKNYKVSRTFLTGANPFVLKTERLLKIAGMVRQYFPECQTLGCFARITDIAIKTDEELQKLHQTGYDGLTIGMETADDEALIFMNKGYLAEDILKQCSRLDAAHISYNFFYLTSISGAGKGEAGARKTAEVCNQLHPKLIGANMLTIYPESELYQEIQRGNWQEEGEIEKYRELKVLIQELRIPVVFAAMGASNAIQMQGRLPEDKEKLIKILEEIISTVSEQELRRYRRNLRHL
ncbi:MAG: radical SAM protein [Eubacteriales bacterium]|nr:radical SAM protein [Eubacteriales bacterium]